MSIPAGVIPCCICKETGKAYILLGRERSGYCCFQGYHSASDKDTFDTACREGGEELCYALGTVEELRSQFFQKESKGIRHELYGGGFMIYLGLMSEKDRMKVQLKFFENRYAGGLGRSVTKCEKEMQLLRWCRADSFYEALLSYKAKKKGESKMRVVLPEFEEGKGLRSWFGDMLLYCLADPIFANLCKENTWIKS